MRELKFRAWDKKNKEWLDKDELFISVLSGEISGWQKDYDWVITQYTGLKDKNGKECYEGDIITQHKSRSSCFGEINGEIIYYPDYAGFAVVTLSDDGQERYIVNLSKGVELEIIGNIFENKIK